MTATASPGLTVADLERALTRAEPAALLVPPRILRRVIKKDRGLGGPGLQVPHRKGYVIGRDSLLRLADRDDLGLPADRELPATLLLFPRPDIRRMDALPREDTLLKYWRLLFHARVHLALARRRADGKLTDAAIRERIARLGGAEFAEIRAVLRQERFLLPPAGPAEVYEEFAALYLELRYFARDKLPVWFPDFCDFGRVDQLLAQDVNGDEIFAATRLEGTPEPTVAEAPEEEEEAEAPPPDDVQAAPAEAPVEEPASRLAAKADRAAARGNRVRAAILRQSAAQAGPPEERPARLAAARNELDVLLLRLRAALHLPEEELDKWREALPALLEPAAAGLWPVEARFLYDLQKVCVDNERAIYAVDLVEWVVSAGRRPIKRPLPNQPLVLTVKHLRSALHRLTAVRIAEPLRRSLVRLLLAAVHRSEQQLRERFHPIIHQALDRVGLKAENYAERVSRDKLIEELLDRVVERRFLGMGDLRDAIARNQLKLPDLAGLREFLLGDKLIRANRQFANDLDGVYRRGEIYLRWLQRLSSAAFGTRVGRALTLFLVLPFGGAYVTLEAVHHIIDLFHKNVGHQATAASTVGMLGSAFAQAPLLAASALYPGRGDGLHLVNRYSVLALGLFLLALMHVGWFRRGVAEWLGRAWHGLRGVCYELPTALLLLPAVQRFLQSRPYQLLYQFVLMPLVWGAPVALACRAFGLGTDGSLIAGAAAFLVAAVLYNSRLGLYVEEVWTDSLARTWQLFSRDLVPGLFRLVMFVFKRLLEDVERLLYAVDELLRFRTGDSRWSLVWKAALGLVWFLVTYLIRLFINLFVEPTFNPIKHFPVVTVTAKLIVPVIRPLTLLIMLPLMPLGKAAALGLAGVVVFFLPGLAGFLVWELKENWRLYRSNRSESLQPEVIGHHGETVLRFMKPGFHSGTLPKLFAKLRRKRGTAAHRQYEALHNVREALRHFVERDLLSVLADSHRWGGTDVESGEVHLGTNRIRFELRCPDLPGASVGVDFEEDAGRVAASLALPPGGAALSWLGSLSPDQR
ncbi:MAG TPA: hypothetical protein VFE78_19635, partial [Gemmataceae bacterium]|nr:hypothetical protein [Gemmataceae bacterium]